MEHKKALFCIFAIIHLFFWIIFSSLNHFKLDTFLSYEIAFFSVLLIIFASYLNYKKVIIKKSKNYEKDFSYKISRHFDYYENLLLWCKIFLKNESFMPYHGKNEAFALLFPMEKIFEDYVAYMLKKVNPAQDIKVQNNGKYLISKNDENCFMLKPDLY
uniref:5-methylcytosine restriction system specificity protein McrC n=1 Tax=Campylobacter jejuni TaxID=197 RepID=UPI0038B3C4BB